MSINRRQKILLTLLFLMILIQTANNTTTLASPANLSSYTVAVINKKNISTVSIEQVYDSNHALHLILTLWFTNSTYKIFNIWDGKYSVIDSGVGYGAQVIKAISLSDGVGVLYIDTDDYYNRILKFYKWTETEENSVVVTSSAETYTVNAFVDYFDEAIHIFWIGEYDYFTKNCSLTSTIIDQKTLKVDINGEYTLPFTPYYIKGIFSANDYLFLVTLYEKWTGSDYQTVYLTQKLFSNNTIINCTSFIIPDYSYPAVSFTRIPNPDYPDFFYIVFAELDQIHTKKVFIGKNQTFDGYTAFLNSTTQAPIGYYYYYEPMVKVSNATAFIALYTIDYFVETLDTSKQINIMLFVEQNNTLLRNEITIAIKGQSTNLQKWFNFAFADGEGNFTVAYAQILDASQFSVHYMAKEMIGVEVASSLDPPKVDPIFIELKVLSNWAYFWYVNWPIIVGVTSSLVLIYALFYKRINKFVRQIKKFLLRPIIETDSKLKLILVNLWLFISGTAKLVWWLWSSNKKRVLVSILGMTIIVSTITISIVTTQSKFGSIVAAEIDNSILGNDWHTSIDFTYTLSSGTSFIFPDSANWTDVLVNDIMSTLMQYAPTYTSSITGYSIGASITNLYLLHNYLGNLTKHWATNLLGYTSDYSVLFSQLLVDGRLPEKPNEIVISTATQDEYDLQVGSILKLCNNPALSDVYYNMTVVGIYSSKSVVQIQELAAKFGLSGDIFLSFTSYYVLVPIEHFGTILQNIDLDALLLEGNIQFSFNFAKSYSQAKAKKLASELETLNYLGSVRFNFGNGVWTYNNELMFRLTTLNLLLISSQFFMLIILVPLLYLGMFLVMETSALFRASYRKEIEILSSKGMSIGRITNTYTIMKILEAIIALIVSVGITFLILPILVKIDTFITFNDRFATPIYDGLGGAVISSFLFMLFITLPDIIKLSIKKERSVKEPKKVFLFFKKFQLLNIFYIVIGLGLSYLSTYLIVVFSDSLAAINPLLLTIFQYLFAIGVMLVFLGIGLLLRDLHKLVVLLLSKIAWKIKKSKISFIIVNIRNDIDLFNKSFLTWMLLVWLILPAILFPLTIQHQTNNEARFYHNADIIIPNANYLNQSTITEVLSLPEIDAWTAITVFSATYGALTFTIEVINDTDAYSIIAYAPPKEFFGNWDASISTLSKKNSMLVSEKYFLYVAGSKTNITFSDVTFNITGTFKQFPGYQPNNEFIVVTSLTNFLLLVPQLTGIKIEDSRIMIKLEDSKNLTNFVGKLKEEYGLQSSSFESYYHEQLTEAFPFYALISTEYTITILVSLVTLVFISVTSPLKTLLYRINKHDVLKKIGVPTRIIIFQTIIEYIVGSLFLGIAIGYAGAKILLHYMTKFLIYRVSDLPFKAYNPVWIKVLIFVIFPLTFITIFAAMMEANFKKYRPINLE